HPASRGEWPAWLLSIRRAQNSKKKPAGRLSRQRVNESFYVSATQTSAGTACRRDDDGDDDARAVS
uniref:hypothetical protein n=1 Tax=Salmonella sp. SAL04284 TaxID=3159862 RepID=UPI00397D664A